jgi:hypothetical protein
MSYRSYRSDSVILLSFAYTSPAYDARVKTCTRRNWVAQYAARFRPGVQFMGYSRSPRYQGKPLHASRVISCVQEPRWMMPDSDFETEGFAFLSNVPGGVASLARNLIGDCGFTDDFVGPDALNSAWRIFRLWRVRTHERQSWTLRFEHLP